MKNWRQVLRWLAGRWGWGRRKPEQPYWELFRDAKGRPRLRLRGANHEILMSGEEYSSFSQARRTATMLEAATGLAVREEHGC